MSLICSVSRPNRFFAEFSANRLCGLRDLNMNFPRVRFSHILPFALLACAAMVPTGCSPEPGVTKYEVPKTTELGKKSETPAAGEYRLLGAMFPADDPEWFFKFTGTADEMTKNEAGFDELLKSVKLTGAGPEFTPPKDWKKGPGREGFVKVFATATTPDGKNELTITQSRGGVGPNLGRWVGQIGLPPGPKDVEKYTKTIETTSGAKGLRVDLRGPNDPTTKRGGPMMPPGRP
jgi:hypothetical protein